jgi:hypothetical protein
MTNDCGKDGSKKHKQNSIANALACVEAVGGHVSAGG